MRFGLSKLAEEDIIEQSTPAGDQSEQKDTSVTCLSDCMYCQNPERTCMVNSVSMIQDEQGNFTCGQYSPQQQVTPEQPQQVPAEATPAVGLEKVKSPAKAEAQAQPQAQAQLGLSKVKGQQPTM